MFRRRLAAGTLIAVVVTAVLAGGGARAADAPPIRHSFPVPGSFSTTAKTAGTLLVLFANGGPGDGCHELAVDIKVDGGAAQSYVVRPGGGINPLIAAQRRGERKVEVQARLTRACSPPAGLQGTLTIYVVDDALTKGQLSFVDRTNAFERAIQPAVTSLAQRRNAVAAALDQAHERAYRATERKHAITDMQIRAAGAHRGVARRLEYLHRAQPLSAGTVADGLAAIRSVGKHLADLERRAVAAARGGGQHRVFDARIKQLRAHLLVLETRIDAKRPNGLEDQWLAVRKELNRVAGLNHDLRIAEAQAERERTVAEDAVRRLAETRGALDGEAFDLLTQLSSFDVDVRDVRVTANGRLVFHLQGQRAQYEHIRELELSIEEAERALKEAERTRARFADRFYATQRVVIAAEARLATEIYDAARWRALIDGVFHAWDLTQAFIKGGPIGLLSVGLQKVIEQRIQEHMRPPGRVEPGSIEEEINRRYNAGLSETLTGERIGYLAGERLVKDTLAKATRDTVGRGLADSLFSRLRAPITTHGLGSTAPRFPALEEIKKWRKATRSFGHLSQQVDNLQKGFKTKGFFGNLAKNAAKDVVKTALKRWVDAVEEEAWVAFFEADMIARATYPAYAATKDHEWEVYEGLEALRARKQRLVDAGWDMRGYTTPVTESFAPDAQLEVRLQAVGLRPSDVPLTVYIGKTAVPFVSRSGDTFTYRGAAPQLETGAQDTLTIG